MAFRSTSRALGCALAVATMLVVSPTPRAVSREAQHRPLVDVCPLGWSRYTCGTVRLCISPDVEGQYGAANSRGVNNSCHSDRVEFGDKVIIPEAWTRATPEEAGYAREANNGLYSLYSRVVNITLSMVKNGDFDKTVSDLLNVNDGAFESFSHGRSEWRPLPRQKSLEEYGLPNPPPTGPEVCPAKWSKFSCKFVRLCVSPSVASNYNLSTSREFGAAECEIDHRIASNEDINFNPHDVGVAAGALVAGPVYFEAVRLDSSDIYDGNLDEAIERLVLVPIPTNGLMEYDRGYNEGLARFQGTLDKAKQTDHSTRRP